MEVFYYTNLFMTALFIFLLILPFAIIIRVILACNKAVADDKNKEIIQRKKNVQKIAGFIKNFNRDTVFGNYIIENDNIIIEVRQDSGGVQYICKNKIIKDNKMQILVFFQKEKPKTVQKQTFFEAMSSQSEVFEDICNNFNEKTDIKKIKELLDMENMSFEEKYLAV